MRSVSHNVCAHTHVKTNRYKDLRELTPNGPVAAYNSLQIRTMECPEND